MPSHLSTLDGCDIWFGLEFDPLWSMCMLMRYYGGFSLTLAIKGGLDQHIETTWFICWVLFDLVVGGY
jgi:hypothetical protein